MKSYFPDINVWLALAYRGHQHHAVAAAWFERVEAEQAVFCRVTQVGFLRLLTHPAVMRDEVKTQQEAWKAYDQLTSDARVAFYFESESARVEAVLRTLTATSRFSPQQWPDAYLASFASVSDLTLVTLDKALGKLAGRECLLLQ
ncbi:MAG: TA system VapC family ribonuclease toxin [Terriglobia bacterium]